MSGPGFIAHEEDKICELCGAEDECRPYGPNYEQICYDCGMKNEELTTQRMEEYIFGAAKSPVH